MSKENAFRSVLIDLLFRLGGWALYGTERYRRWRRQKSVPPDSARVFEQGSADLATSLRSVNFELGEQPQLTILITSYGKASQVAACLCSIAEHPPDISFEVIVADDASGDPEMLAIADVPGLRFLPSSRTLGYLRTVNRASKLARGEFLWLLNDDTLVTAGAANALLTTLTTLPNCAAVGSRLLNVDGSVQEAGSIVWRDGTATNVGAGTDRSDATTRYTRDVDYCSAASLMLRSVDFATVGGYDDTFAPAYYEDTDLAFRLRADCGRVVMQPASEVVHLGGGSYGSAASRQLLQVNRHKFVARWRRELASHCQPGNESFFPRDRIAKCGSVLVLSESEIHPEIIERLVAADFIVKVWIYDRAFAASLVDDLGALGVETVSANSDEQLGRWLAQHGSALDFSVTIGETHQQSKWRKLIERYGRTERPPHSNPLISHFAQFGADEAGKLHLMAILAEGPTTSHLPS